VRRRGSCREDDEADNHRRQEDERRADTWMLPTEIAKASETARPTEPAAP
jgi:hypothetical protein